MKKGWVPRILITLLGIGMIWMGAAEALLGFAGNSAPAVITDIRREGGERAESNPGRYTYNISYTFTLPDGKKINGFAKQIGSAVFLKADGTSVTQVRYLPAFPAVNAMERDTGLGVRQMVLMLAGGFLIAAMNRPKDVRKGPGAVAGTGSERKKER